MILVGGTGTCHTDMLVCDTSILVNICDTGVTVEAAVPDSW